MAKLTGAALLLAVALPLPCFGAANITFSSPSVAADGITLTVTASAAIVTASNLGPCFTVAGASATAAVVASASANGTTTVTILGTANAPWYHEDTLTLNVTTAPTCPAVDGSGNTPQGQSGVAITNASEWYAACGPTMTAHARFNALSSCSTRGGYQNSIAWGPAGGSIDVSGSGSELDILAFEYTNQFEAFQFIAGTWTALSCPGSCATQHVTDANNGVTNYVTQASNSQATVWGTVVLATGLSGTNTYRIFAGFGQPAAGSAPGMIVSAVRLVGGMPTGTKPAGTLKIIGGIGESNSWSGGSGPVDACQYDTGYLSCYSVLNVAAMSSGIPGTPCASVKDRMTDLLPLGIGNPDIILVSEGANDAEMGTALPAYTACMEQLLCNLNNFADCGDGHLDTSPPALTLVRGLTSNYGSGSGPYNAGMQSAVSAVLALHPSAPIKYFPSFQWFNQTATPCPTSDISSADGLHYCGTLALGGHGFGKLAQAEYPIFYAALNSTSSYTLAGPSTGTAGQPSTNFTITAAPGSTFGGYYTFTPTSSCGGVFTPATLTPASGTTATFTYAAPGAGTCTVSVSNVGAGTSTSIMTDPSGISFTAAPGVVIGPAGRWIIPPQ